MDLFDDGADYDAFEKILAEAWNASIRGFWAIACARKRCQPGKGVRNQIAIWLSR